MAALRARWQLVAVTLATVAVWGLLSPASLLLGVGLLSAFGCVFGWVQYALESSPERRGAGR